MLLPLAAETVRSVLVTSPLIGAREMCGVGIPQGPCAGLLSSRIVGATLRKEPWLRHLQAVVSHYQESDLVLLTVPKTACHPYLSRPQLIATHGTRVVNPPPSGMSIRQWRRRFAQPINPRHLWVSPELDAVDGLEHGTLNSVEVATTKDLSSPHQVSPENTPRFSSKSKPVSFETLPLRDRLLLAFADVVYLLHVRTGGNLYRMLKAAGEADLLALKRIYVATESELVPRDIAQICFDQGALDWSTLPDTFDSCLCCQNERRRRKRRRRSGVVNVEYESGLDCERYTGPQTPCLLQHHPDAWLDSPYRSAHTPITPATTLVPIIPLPTKQAYLLHWTRRRVVPLQGETASHFIDQLLWQCRDKETTPLPTLLEILASGKLLANSNLTRSAEPVVCFTARSLNDFASLHRYRPHLRRWDFEPFGLGIVQSVLEERFGARPVMYGSETDWQRLALRDRPWFQFCQERTHGNSDWTLENEWRVAGHVDLHALSFDEAFVFVSTESQAARIAPLSPWPIVITPTA